MILKNDKAKMIDPFVLITLILQQAGLTDEDYARERGLFKDTIPMQRLLNEKQAIDYLGGLSRATFYRLVKADKIRQVHLGQKNRRYDIKDLNAYIKACKRQQIKEQE